MEYRPLRFTGIALGAAASAWAFIFAALLLLLGLGTLGFAGRTRS